MKIVFTILVFITFLVYVYLAADLLFFSRAWLRTYDELSFVEFFRFNSNLIPFAEIFRKIGVIISGSPSASIARLNLFGNLFIFAPMGFYLPYFWNKMKGLRIYALSTAMLIIGVEAAQLVTRSGIVDIDDFILNFIGALLGFAICRYLPVRHLFKYRAY